MKPLMSRGGSSWLYVTPIGIRKMMNWIKKEYGAEVPIYITENGLSDRIGNLDDMHRKYYYKHYINQLLKGRIRMAILCNSKILCKSLNYDILFSYLVRWGELERLFYMVSYGQLRMGSRISVSKDEFYSYPRFCYKSSGRFQLQNIVPYLRAPIVLATRC